jgi:hypothetical protein
VKRYGGWIKSKGAGAGPSGPLFPGVRHSRNWCPGRDLNPHSACAKKDFKSFASANFATRAWARLLNFMIIDTQVNARRATS